MTTNNVPMEQSVNVLIKEVRTAPKSHPKYPQWELKVLYPFSNNPQWLSITYINKGDAPKWLLDHEDSTNVNRTVHVKITRTKWDGTPNEPNNNKFGQPHAGTEPYHYNWRILPNQSWDEGVDEPDIDEENSTVTTYDFSDGGGMHTSSYSDSEEVINDALQSKDERYPNFDATQHMIMSQSFGKSSGMPSGEFALRNYQVEDEDEKLMNRHNYMLEFFRTHKTLTDVMTEYTARLGNLPDGMSDEDFVSKFSGYVAQQEETPEENDSEEDTSTDTMDDSF